MRAEREARESARPSRNDSHIAAIIPAPLSSRNADGAPALAPPIPYQAAAHPAVANVAQLLPRVASGTGHGHQKRRKLVAVASGQEPPSVQPRTSDLLTSVFSEIQAQDALNRSPAFCFLFWPPSLVLTRVSPV
jgi:hypothetical protein